MFILSVSRYKIIRDPEGWLDVGKDTGLIKVKRVMDRESPFVKDDKYTALIGAYDNGRLEAGLSRSPGFQQCFRVKIWTLSCIF